MNWFNFQQMEWLAMVLLHSLWIGALLSVVLVLVNRLFRFSSNARYLAGTGALALFMLCMVVITVMQFPGEKSSGTSVVFEAGTVLSEDAAVSGASGWLVWIRSYAPVFLQTWFLGMMFLLLRLIGGYQYLNQLKRKATAEVPARWLESIANIKSHWRMNRQVEVLASVHIDMPMVFGHIKPVLLLPVSMLSGLSQDQLDAIFAHELAHIRRNDFIVHFVQSVIESVFFFNPFIWWMSRYINDMREQCCDDLALSYASTPVSYANALSDLEDYRAALLAVGLGKGKKSMLERIRRLIEPEYTPSTSYRVFLVALILSAGFFSFNAVKPAQESDSWIAVKHYSPDNSIDRHAYSTVAVPLLTASVALPAATDTIPDERVIVPFGDSVVWDSDWDVDADFDFDYDVDSDVDVDLDIVFDQLNEIDFDAMAEIRFDTFPDVAFAVPNFEFVIPPLEEIQFSQMNFNFEPVLFLGDTSKLSEKERAELREAREELQKAREELRQLELEHRERLREEMQKIRELQREEWEIQRKELERVHKEFREQFPQGQVIDEEQREKIERQLAMARVQMHRMDEERVRQIARAERLSQDEVRRVHADMLAAQREMALSQRELARREHARAQHDIARARVEVRRYKQFHTEVEEMLRRDNYLKDGEKLRKLKISDDAFRFNGKKVLDRDLDKYLGLYKRRYGNLEGGTYEYSE